MDAIFTGYSIMMIAATIVALTFYAIKRYRLWRREHSVRRGAETDSHGVCGTATRQAMPLACAYGCGVTVTRQSMPARYRRYRIPSGDAHHI